MILCIIITGSNQSVPQNQLFARHKWKNDVCFLTVLPLLLLSIKLFFLNFLSLVLSSKNSLHLLTMLISLFWHNVMIWCTRKIETMPDRLYKLYLTNSISEDVCLIIMIMFVGFKNLHLIHCDFIKGGFYFTYFNC